MILPPSFSRLAPERYRFSCKASTNFQPPKTGQHTVIFSEGAVGSIDNFRLRNKITAGGLTDQGGRPNDLSEDGFALFRKTGWFRPREEMLALLVDGMGGHGDGEKAAHCALAAMMKKFAGQFDFLTALAAAEQMIAEEKAAGRMHDEADTTAGTTVVGVQIGLANRPAKLVHIGDSRAYLFRRNELCMLTLDDIYLEDFIHAKFSVNPLLRRLERSPAMLYHQYKMMTPPLNMVQSRFVYELCQLYNQDKDYGSKISQAVGGVKQTGRFPPAVLELPLQSNDLILLTSDGVEGAIEYDQLSRVIGSNLQRSPGSIAQAVRQAVTNPTDNATVVVLRYF
ncbi:MAG: hypothetical protein JW873_04145 [Candidatus Saganbacteria bacterium]|nr:hypothetical protein [Candidatus Saganbacteria bacterium]